MDPRLGIIYLTRALPLLTLSNRACPSFHLLDAHLAVMHGLRHLKLLFYTGVWTSTVLSCHVQTQGIGFLVFFYQPAISRLGLASIGSS
jgi:hypothetical protein